MYSYNIGKMSIIYLDNNKKKIQEVYLRELMSVFYDKQTSDRLKRLNKISHINIDESQNK